MNRQAVVLLAILMVISQVAIGQSTVDTPAEQSLAVSPILGPVATIPEGYTLRLSTSYPPYERRTNFGYGQLTVGLAGVFGATVRYEGAIGSPIGLLRPTTLVGLHLQVVPQREIYPAVLVFLSTMAGPQSEFLGSNDLIPNLPAIFQRGVEAISYEARTTVAGVAFMTAFNNMLSVSASLGGREMVWEQRWSKYSVYMGLPSTSDGWTFPTAERSSLRLDWSAGATFHPLNKLALFGEIASLPFADVDPSSLIIEARQGYMGTIGVRYYLPIPLSIDLFDRWYSETGERTNYHQVRLGLSTEVVF